MLIFLVPLLIVKGTSNVYVALLFFTTVPTLGVGFVIFGFMDRMADYVWGIKSTIAMRNEKESFKSY